MSRDDMSESDPWKEILPVLQWHYGTVKWRPRVDGRWNCCSEMFSLGYWWIVSQCNTPGYVWIYILYSYMKGFGQVRFNFDDIWQRVNFVAQRVSEQTGKLSGGPRVFDPRVRQIFRARLAVAWGNPLPNMYTRISVMWFPFRLQNHENRPMSAQI